MTVDCNVGGPSPALSSCAVTSGVMMSCAVTSGVMSCAVMSAV